MLPHKAAHRPVIRRGGLYGCSVFGGVRFQLLELQLQLIEQPAALGRGPKPLSPQLRDQQLQMRHHRLGARRSGFGLLPRRALGHQHRFQRIDVVGEGLGRRHKAIVARASIARLASAQPESNRRSDQPAACGRQLSTGLRQSIPSST